MGLSEIQHRTKIFFVHFTGIAQEGFKSLKEGQQVTFEITRGAHGVQATHVVVVEND